MDMRIKDIARITDVVQPGRDLGFDECRDLAQIKPETSRPHAIVNRGLIVCPRLTDKGRAFCRVFSQACQEVQGSVGGVPLVTQPREERLLLVNPVPFKPFGVIEDQGRMITAPHGERLRGGNIDQIVALHLRVERIGQTT